MPPRKSDTRRSDARFVPVNDEPEVGEEPSAAPAPSAPSASAATDPSPSEPPSAAQTTPQRKEKGKEKEKDSASKDKAQDASKDKAQDSSKDKEKDAITIEDLTLPRSIITRMAKGVLPPNTQIQSTAIAALTKSATVFISHLATNANEYTLSAGKKTIAPADVFQALDEIEFGFMRERVEAEFAKFNQIQTSKRTDYRKKVKAQKKGDTAGADSSILAPDVSMMSIATQDGENEGGEGGSRAAKKARIDTAGGDESRMEVDGEGAEETSDAETVPDEEADGDETEEEAEEEAEEEEEEVGEDEREGNDVGGGMREEDEALEEDSD